MKKLISVLLCMMVLLSAPAFTARAEEPAAEGGLQKDVVILYTSDIHCGVAKGFGMAGLKAVRDSLEAQGNYTILVDNGDAIQGEPIGTMTRGESVVKLMNEAGYDIAIPGNHEFDFGMERFLELTGMAGYPYISCNFNKEGELVFDPYIIKEIDGVKIAFVGVTTPQTLTTSMPVTFMDEDGDFVYGFCQGDNGKELYSAVQTAVDDAREEGADYVIVMSHLGDEASAKPWTYADVIGNTTGIDVLMDGHSHDTEQVQMKDKDGNTVIRTACGTKLEGIGWVRIPKDPEAGLSSGLYSWENDVPAPELLGITNEMSGKVAEKMDALSETLKEVIGKASVTLTSNDPKATNADGSPIRIIRNAETNLGDFCADAFREESGADIAFMNGGAIRADMQAGNITKNTILSLYPFGNELTVLELTGQKILDALEWSVHLAPEEFGGFLQVSGLTFTYRTDIDSPCIMDNNSMCSGIEGERRVQEVLVGGEPIDPDKTYTVAGADYLLRKNGDGHTAFDDATIILMGAELDNQVLMDYISDSLGGVVGEGYEDPYGEGRIVAIETEDP